MNSRQTFFAGIMPTGSRQNSPCFPGGHILSCLLQGQTYRRSILVEEDEPSSKNMLPTAPKREYKSGKNHHTTWSYSIHGLHHDANSANRIDNDTVVSHQLRIAIAAPIYLLQFFLHLDFEIRLFDFMANIIISNFLPLFEI